MVRSKGTVYTIEDVDQAFEKQQGEALVEHVEWWEKDPEDFLRAHRHLDIDQSGPTEHPWGGETITICYRWIREATPYRLWCFKETVNTKTLEIVRESLLEMATGYADGFRISNASSKAFSTEVKALREQLSETTKPKAV